MMKDVFEILTKNMSDDKVAAADVLSDIAVELVDYRVTNNLDQKDMARILNVSQPMISKYESGTYNFTIKTLFEIAYKLGLDIDFFIHGKRKDDLFIDNSVYTVREKKKKNQYSYFFENNYTSIESSDLTIVA